MPASLTDKQLYDRAILTATRSENGCLLASGHVGKDGRVKMTSRRWRTNVSRFIYCYVHGNLSMDILVCHKCDNPLCIEVSHLFPGTQLDNMTDAKNKGRLSQGEGRSLMSYGQNNGNAKLSQEDVNRIRERLANRERARTIATDYGIGEVHVSAIKHRKSWR